MRIYFVRHGETEDAARGLFQKGSSELSLKGVEQSRALANRFQSIPIDIICCSPFTRAQQTAQIINKTLHAPIEYLDAIKELKKPSEILGKSNSDSNNIKIQKQLYENFGNNKWRYSDEENFFDLKKRGIIAMEYFKTLKKDNILIVSHGTIIRMIISLMMYGNDVSLKEFLDVQEFFGMDNTGISVCSEEGYRGWRLITWNDIQHL